MFIPPVVISIVWRLDVGVDATPFLKDPVAIVDDASQEDESLFNMEISFVSG